jgi:benzodiazapine receptor
MRLWVWLHGLVWKEKGLTGARTPFVLFVIQLAFNALWSWLFFAWRQGLLAEIEILVLLALIALTVVAFWRVWALAGVLLLPYLLWVTYATALTFALVGRNPGVF